MSKYVIGIDFGSLSGRALMADARDGREIASAVMDYPHGVMDQRLPDGTPLPQDWALQHPQDYLDVLFTVVPAVIRDSGADPRQIIGIGTDFTSCTVMPVRGDGTPLCFLPQYAGSPHAYVKLWKHHAAQDLAIQMTETARTRNEKWLNNYGGKISSEWSIPKLWQVLKEAPDIYESMDCWVEAADWMIWQLTGNYVRNACSAGYKALYNKREGVPSKEYFAALNPRLANVMEDKLKAPVAPLGGRAGGLTVEMAKRLGLTPGIAVAVGNVDAHVGLPALGIDGPGKLMAIMGTSTCHIVLGTGERQVPGMCGVVEDGVMPGYYGYEAGQSCVGDHFAWLADRLCPAAYFEQAKKLGMSTHQYLTSLARRLRPGQSGLIALDWWNGNRSVLVDADLTGLLLGMTLQTSAEEIYRALIEATAYGTRMIVENFRRHGVPVDEIYASGGISQKNDMAMQIYADTLNLPVKVAGTAQGAALGSAIFASVAAGGQAGGYDDVFEAARRMGKVQAAAYQPNAESAAVYEKLYQEYAVLHDYFGRGENDVMKRLKAIKKTNAGGFCHAQNA